MFKLSEKKYIPLSDVEIQCFVDDKFSTKHIHLACDSNEKCFVVAFKTLPSDSTGVAHILEHTVLCGSKKYPVRDPFFMMTRRSLSTFMNAFTASDFTAYPFSTLNDKDFKNLLSVYLDATFFPNLNQLDFMQEGHRFELSKLKDGSEKLELKGIVYNEMKGAMSSISSQADQGINEFLFPNHTYGFNSGGEPEDILNLTYDNLLEFHRKHYHPSNAVFFTYGNIDINSIQDEIQSSVLSSFNPSLEKIEVKESEYFKTPRYGSKNYKPLSGDENNYHVIISWLLGSSLDPVDKMEAKLIESILLENSASPLAKALEVSKIGRVPSDLTSFDTYKKQMFFVAGLEGVAKNKEKEVEDLVINVFKKLVKEGIPKSIVDASLHQMEIKLKKISGGFPYGLQLLMGSMPYILHDADIIKSYDLEKSLNELKKRLTKINYLENKLDEMFIKNSSRLTFQLIPDDQHDKKKLKKINDYISNKQELLSKLDRENIRKNSELLEIRQSKKDDPNILPKVTVNDVGKSKSYPKSKSYISNGTKKNYYKAGTNGIDYYQAIHSIIKPTFDDLKYATLFADIMCEVGIKEKNYEDIQKLQSEILGQITSNFTILRDVNNSSFKLGIKMGGYSLQSKSDEMKELINETIENFRLDEIDRINEITKMHISGLEKSLTNAGHYFAMTSADAQMSFLGVVSEVSGGISYLKNLKNLRLPDGNTDVQKLIGIFQNLKNKIVIKPTSDVTVSSNDLKLVSSESDKVLNDKLEDITGISLFQNGSAWLTETDVNFCAQSFKSVGYKHPDAPVLTVLGAVLRNGFLHTAIREKGGAYGSGAMQDMSTKTFKFFSYRDPNVALTFDAFNESINWAVKSITKDKLEEGILNIISSIDKPSSPASEALADYSSNNNGYTQQMRTEFRQKVIETTVERLIEVAETYLTVECKKSVLSNKKFENELKSLNLETKQV